MKAAGSHDERQNLTFKELDSDRGLHEKKSERSEQMSRAHLFNTQTQPLTSSRRIAKNHTPSQTPLNIFINQQENFMKKKSKDMSRAHENAESARKEARETQMEKRGYRETTRGRMTRKSLLSK